MAVPEYCDKRARKFFTRGFVGPSHGENGTNYMFSWCSHADGLISTAVHVVDRTHFCAYCGNRAFPIQGLLARRGIDDYSVTGYTCCCTGAVDEVEYQARLEALKQTQYHEMAAMKKTAPIQPKEVLISLARMRLNKLLRDIDQDFFSATALEDLKIIKAK